MKNTHQCLRDEAACDKNQLIDEFDYQIDQIALSKRDLDIIKTLQSDELNLKMFLTGSARWGAPKPRDIDIVVLGQLKDSVKKMINDNASEKAKLAEKHPTEQGSLGSLRFIESKLNLIFVPEADFDYWKKATEMMACLPYIINTTIRHATFEILRGLVKNLNAK